MEIEKFNRLYQLDSLRGICAIMVVVYHYFYRYDSIYGYEDIHVMWSYIGQFGVYMFFIISGFVINKSVNSKSNCLLFLKSRIYRIYPTYWFCLAMTFMVITYFGLAGREVSISEASLNILMFHHIFNVNNVDGVYWSLQAELAFYLICTISYMFKRISLSYILIFVISATTLSKFFHSALYSHFLLFKLEYLPVFLIGVVLADKKTSIKERIFIKFFSIFTIWILFGIKTALLLVCLSIIFQVIIRTDTHLINNKYLLFIGTISYPLYLIHQNIGYVIINELRSIGVSSLAAIFLTSLISVFLSYIIHIRIEKNKFGR